MSVCPSQSVLLVPKLEISEFPVKSFYRYVGGAGGGGGGRVAELSSTALFTNLPRQHVLTVRVDIPEPWNVQTKAASQDIDNLRCVPGKSCGDLTSPPSALSSRYKQDLTQVVYGLKNILVAGQCFTTDGQSGEADQSQLISLF